MWCPSYRLQPLLESPKGSCSPWPSFLGPHWSWCEDLAPNDAHSIWLQMSLPDTRSMKMLQKKHYRETGPTQDLDTPTQVRLGKTTVVGLRGPGIMSQIRWSPEWFTQHNPAAGAHLERDNTAMDRMENDQCSWVRQTTRSSPQAVP